METANKLRTGSRDGSFEVDSAPNPHGLVMEHSKTLITISAAFVGLAATFSDKLLGDSPQGLQIVLFILLWVCILAGLFCGIKATSCLHKFLFWPEPKAKNEKNETIDEATAKQTAAEEANKGRRKSAWYSNIGPWWLMFAGIFALLLILSKLLQEPMPQDSGKCVKICIAYLNSFSGMAGSNWSLDKLTWNKSNETFSITLTIPQSTTAFALTVDAKKGMVMDAKRLGVEAGENPSRVRLANTPVVVSNFVQMPLISNFVQVAAISNFNQMPAITNYVQTAPISNFIQMPPFSNITFVQPSPSTNRGRRWIFGVGAERQD